MQRKLFPLIIFVLLISIFTPVSAQNAEDYPIYIVQSGDTLGTIALLFDTTTDDLIALNNIADPNSIYPGLQLSIPGMSGIHGVISPITIDLGESWQNLLVKYQLDDVMMQRLNGILNYASLYAGFQLLAPIQSEAELFEPKAIIDNGSSLLEKSVFLNENPSSLEIRNFKKSSIEFYTDDVIYSNNPGQQNISPLSVNIAILEVSPLPLTQGDTVVVHIQTIQPATLSGNLNGHELNFYTQDQINFVSLQGIHAMAEPGVTNLSISGTYNSGQFFSINQNLLLQSGDFDSDPPLTVSPEMIDPNITGPEMEKIISIISAFTPEQRWSGAWLSPDHDYATVIPNYEERKEITSFFGSRRTYNDDPQITFHTGIDFGGGTSLPIVAPAAGKVVFADFLDIRGNATIIDHGLGVYSAYYHQSIIDVKQGDFVEKGQKIGEVGNTGRVDRSDEYEGAGAHLHWEIWVNGIQVNPLDWINSEYP